MLKRILICNESLRNFRNLLAMEMKCYDASKFIGSRLKERKAKPTQSITRISALQNRIFFFHVSSLLFSVSFIVTNEFMVVSMESSWQIFEPKFILKIYSFLPSVNKKCLWSLANDKTASRFTNKFEFQQQKLSLFCRHVKLEAKDVSDLMLRV